MGSNVKVNSLYRIFEVNKGSSKIHKIGDVPMGKFVKTEEMSSMSDQ